MVFIVFYKNYVRADDRTLRVSLRFIETKHIVDKEITKILYVFWDHVP
jgi:hypothetical protein